MLFDGIKLVEGSEFQNLVIDAGTSFPASPNIGEMFYRTDAPNTGLYVYDGTQWDRHANFDDLSALGGDYVLKAGDTMTGTLVLSGAPTADLHAATKRYVDDTAAAAVSSIPWSAITGEPTTLGGYGITDAQPLDGDLTAIANIAATSGLLRKIAANTWTLDTADYITGNEAITVTGDASGTGTTSIALTLATTGVAAGSYGTTTAVPTIAVDSKGRITSASNTSIAIDASAVTSGTFANARISSSSVTQHQASLTIVESQISDGSLLARVAGNETISGTWTFSNPVAGQSPSSPSHLATKDYVDNVAAGINPHAAVRVATTANITLSGTQTIDGVAVSVGDRVLVKDQTSAADNGIYVVSAGTWTRAPDFDGSPSNEVAAGDLVFVEEGTTNSNSSWVMVTPGTISVGVTPLNFSVFSRAGDFEAGDGLIKTGNTFNVGTASSSRIVVNADDIDLATVANAGGGSFVKIARDNYGRVTGTSGVVASDITSLVDATYVNATGDTMTGNLTFSGTGLRISGDFSNATASNRLSLTSSTANGNTFVQAIPNGTGTSSAFISFSSSNINNSSFGAITATSSDVTLSSSRTGSGSFLPLNFSTSGSTILQISTGGRVSVLSGDLAVTGAASTTRYAYFQSGAVNRWHVGADNSAESGGNGGSNFNITAYTDAGVAASQFAFGINRSDSCIIMGGTLVENVRSLGTVSGSTSVDLRNCNYISATIGGATTLTFTNPPPSGYASSWIFEITNGGSATITWPGSVTWVSGSAPTLRASGINLVGIITRNGGTSYLGILLA